MDGLRSGESKDLEEKGAKTERCLRVEWEERAEMKSEKGLRPGVECDGRRD